MGDCMQSQAAQSLPHIALTCRRDDRYREDRHRGDDRRRDDRRRDERYHDRDYRRSGGYNAAPYDYDRRRY